MAAIVFLAAAFLLVLGTDRIPFTASYQDRVGHISSQDEATYSHVAIQMVQSGDWLTPHLDGRLFLMKPPLLYWLSGAAVKLFGYSRLALRSPSVLAGALAIALAFAWCGLFRNLSAGFIAAVLMLSNAPWQTMSRLNCMDVLVSCCIGGAMLFLARDPALERRSSRLGFGMATGAAILAKSVVGVIPVLVLAAFAIANRGAKRLTVGRAIRACGFAFLVAAPWHLYQLAVHPEWFVADYIRLQIFGFGVAPPTAATESHLWFYGRRLFLTDPILTVLALTAVAGLTIALVRRNEEGERDVHSLLLTVWILVVVAAILAFQALSFLYASLLILPLCILAAGYLPVPRRLAPLVLLALVALGAGKVYARGPWDLAFDRIDTPAIQADLRTYAATMRPNELIAVGISDDFYALLLPISGVRYCLVDPGGFAARYAPHLAKLGFVMPAAEYIRPDHSRSLYAQILHRWGMHSLGWAPTMITAQGASDIPDIVDASPESDFLVPAAFLDSYRERFTASHDIKVVSPRNVLLFARRAPSQPRTRFLPYLPAMW